MKFSVCMIVKNEAEMLERTLPEVSKAADELIVLDTGSSDATIKVAEKYGAKVHEFKWVNDFSAARNESLKYASGDWVLWLDADEYIKPEDLRTLKDTLAHSEASDHSLTLYESKIGQCETKNGFQRTKVFRNGQGYHFIRPINEQLVDEQGRVASGNVIPVSIYHWGKNLAEERMKAKRERYVKLYSEALAQSPNDPYIHFLLGNNLNELGRLAESAGHYSRAYELAPKKDIGKQALEKLAQTQLRSKQLAEAAGSAQTLIELDPKSVVARNVFASIYLVSGKVDEAIKVLTEALNIKTDGLVENQYQSKAMPNFLLSKAYQLKGDKAKADACLAEYRRIMN